MDITKVYAKAPQMLWDAQEKYEKNIISYVESREHWVNCSYEYEKAFAEEIESLKKNKDMAVGIVKEVAKKNCLKQYKDMLEAETIKKKFSYFIEAGKEKINTIKALMKDAKPN